MRTLIILMAFVAVSPSGSATRWKTSTPRSRKANFCSRRCRRTTRPKRRRCWSSSPSSSPKPPALPGCWNSCRRSTSRPATPTRPSPPAKNCWRWIRTIPNPPLQNLKAAEAKKDLPRHQEMGRRGLRQCAQDGRRRRKPNDAEQADTWKTEVDYAKQVDQYTDYALYRVAAESRDPKVTVEFVELLQTHNPKSEYVPKAQNQLFVAYRQAGANDKALALAEKTLATDQTNEDMLLVVTDSYSRNKKEPEKVHAYSAKLVELMASQAQARRRQPMPIGRRARTRSPAWPTT